MVGVWWFASQSTEAEQGWTKVTTHFALCGVGPREEGCVVDGDTVLIGVLIGAGPQKRRIRLTGFDTPELDGACDAERKLARTAKARLHRWLGQGPFEWDGGDNPPRDQYGRELRAARRIADDGSEETLAEYMIASGLAANNGWGQTPGDWCT
ncbi:hypothetical protein EH31_14900 [Erythrobacter longus]|uniref:TNase-like domain-containing protein n=1 Tax=Erythrobacter longus TaxID=1044 RepID=A0A074MSX6_ERYLO|nr:hypothetical protein EH31_14900 [Erythrobacter longus]